MGDIYKNATITIAAGSTTSVEESFLADRPIPRSCCLPYLLPGGNLGNLWVADCAPRILLSPLDSRAWALQESLLSSRVLWYGPADLKWKCSTNPFDNVYDNHAHNFMYPANRLKRLPPQIYGQSESPIPSTLDEKSEIWCRVLEDYSGRDLTFAEDRLPAIAGVVSELQNIWGDEYYAGMWEPFLIRHLGWYNTAEAIAPPNDADFVNLHIPASPRSPSWSWASYFGRVDIYEVLEEYAEVLECTVVLADSSVPLGRVTDGKLVLMTACLTEAQRLETNFNDSWFKWDYNHCAQQDHINIEFIYAYLGKTATMGSLALVLHRQLDGTYARMGILFNFSFKTWPGAAMKKRVVTLA